MVPAARAESLDAAKATTKGKLAAEKAAMPALRTFMSALVTYIKAGYGGQPDVLADFGIQPPKARAPQTVEAKAAAAKLVSRRRLHRDGGGEGERRPSRPYGPCGRFLPWCRGAPQTSTRLPLLSLHAEMASGRGQGRSPPSGWSSAELSVGTARSAADHIEPLVFSSRRPPESGRGTHLVTGRAAHDAPFRRRARRRRPAAHARVSTQEATAAPSTYFASGYGARVRAAAAVALVLLCALPVDASAYRPYDCTDADVAEPYEWEFEMQALGYDQAARSRYFVAGAVLNYGLLPRVELVLQGFNFVPYDTQPGPDKLTETDLFAKVVWRQGCLQMKSGASISTETGALLPPSMTPKALAHISEASSGRASATFSSSTGMPRCKSSRKRTTWISSAARSSNRLLRSTSSGLSPNSSSSTTSEAYRPTQDW
jgi:hypothetical protein